MAIISCDVSPDWIGFVEDEADNDLFTDIIIPPPSSLSDPGIFAPPPISYSVLVPDPPASVSLTFQDDPQTDDSLAGDPDPKTLVSDNSQYYPQIDERHFIVTGSADLMGIHVDSSVYQKGDKLYVSNQSQSVVTLIDSNNVTQYALKPGTDTTVTIADPSQPDGFETAPFQAATDDVTAPPVLTPSQTNSLKEESVSQSDYENLFPEVPAPALDPATGLPLTIPQTVMTSAALSVASVDPGVASQMITKTDVTPADQALADMYASPEYQALLKSAQTHKMIFYGAIAALAILMLKGEKRSSSQTV